MEEKKFNHVSLRLDDVRYAQLKEIADTMGLSLNSMMKMIISQTYASMKKSEEMVQGIVQDYLKTAISDIDKQEIREKMSEIYNKEK